MFISKDPIEFESGDFNHYRYVGNDPVNYVDPSGLEGTPWMNTAKGELGQKEVVGKFKSNPNIMAYHKAAKFGAKDDSTGKNAWCGSFAAWVMKKNGYIPPKNSFRAKSWKNFGKKVANPVYGAIAVKSRKGGGHVAFVLGKSKDGKSLYVIGGNQDDSVSIKEYPLSVWEDFRVPKDANTETCVLPTYCGPSTEAGKEG